MQQQQIIVVHGLINCVCDSWIRALEFNSHGVWEVRAGVQVSMRELHTHIHLDYVRVEILSCKKKILMNSKNLLIS